MTTSASVTESVVTQHVKTLVTRNLDAIVNDYSADAVLFAPNGAFKGKENIRAFFEAALGMLPKEATDNLKVLSQSFDGEFAYVLWSALPAVGFAGDSFCVRDGKIVMQCFVTQMG